MRYTWGVYLCAGLIAIGAIAALSTWLLLRGDRGRLSKVGQVLCIRHDEQVGLWYAQDGCDELRVVVFFNLRDAPSGAGVPETSIVLRPGSLSHSGEGGLYIDGKKHKVREGLQTYFVSDMVPCREVSLSEGQTDWLLSQPTRWDTAQVEDFVRSLAARVEGEAK
jgi:hypothetical protein